MNKQKQLINILKELKEEDFNKVLEYASTFNIEHNTSDEQITIQCCPHCGTITFKKNGFDSLGNQRYLCKDCHFSFSCRTNTFFSHTKIEEKKWIKFIDYEITGMTLKEEAYFLQLSIHTCFRMRHKLYAAIQSYQEKVKVEEKVQLDAAYRKINLKGTKPENMPRFSKKRGYSSAYSGISHHKVCIISALDEQDNMFLKIVGLGSESTEKYKQCLNYMGNVKTIISDSKSCIQQFANEVGADHDVIPTVANKKRYTTKKGEHLADINQLDSEITSLITKTHGVCIKYFQGYLDFLTFKKQVKYQVKREEMATYIFRLIKGTKAFTEEEIIFTELPISLKEAYYEYHYGIFA